MSHVVAHRAVPQRFQADREGLLPIRDTGRSGAQDETLRSRIVAALEADPIVSPCAALMAIRCEDGAVLLGGLVDTPRLRQYVASVVATVEGVAAVMNRLRIRDIQVRSPFVG